MSSSNPLQSAISGRNGQTGVESDSLRSDTLARIASGGQLAKKNLVFLGDPAGMAKLASAGVLIGALSAVLMYYRDAAGFISIGDRDALTLLTVSLFLLVSGLLLVRRFFPGPSATALFLFSFLVRVALCLSLSWIFQYDDEIFFHGVGVSHQYGITGLDGNGFYHLINLLYAILGPNLLYPKLLNAFFGSLLPFFVADLAFSLASSPEAARRALRLAAFFPPLLIYSCLNLKELLTAFGMVLALGSLARQKTLVYQVLMGAASLVFLYWLRGMIWTLPALFGMGTFFLVRFMRPLLLQRRFDLRTCAILFGGAIFLFWLGPLVYQKAVYRLSQEFYFIRGFQESSASVMTLVDRGDVLSLRNVVVLFVRGLFSPSPFRLVFDWGTGTVIEALNTASWYLIFPFGVMGLFATVGEDLAWACGMTMTVILFLSNTTFLGGDPYRHRIISLGLFLALAAIGLRRQVRARFRWVPAGWWLASFVFTMVWVSYRA